MDEGVKETAGSRRLSYSRLSGGDEAVGTDAVFVSQSKVESLTRQSLDCARCAILLFQVTAYGA